MTSPTGPTFKQDVSQDAQMLLQRMAQDASSQAGDGSTDTRLHQHEETASQAINHQALVNGHALSSPKGTAPEASNGISSRHEPNVQLDAVGAQAWDASYETFAQSALSNGPSSLTQANIQALADDPMLEATASLADIESEPPRIQAFAKLEFDDGEFYMNTYSVELGRDIRAARQVLEWDTQACRQSSRKRSSSDRDPSPSSSKSVKHDSGRHAGNGIVNGSGGVMGVDHSDSGPSRRRRRKKSKSTTSSSQQLSRKSSTTFLGMRTDYQSLALESLSDPLPSPDSCPLVPIHPPTSIDGVPTSRKSISRKHVKIAFNFERHLFELTVMGRNGAFVDDQWYPAGDTQPLRSGSLIQIGGVGIRFLLPDVALGETGAKNHPNSDPTSFEVESGNGVDGDTGDSSDDGRDEQDEDEDESRDDSNDDESEESDRDGRSENVSEEEIRGRPREPKPTLANRPIRNKKPVRGKEPTKTKELPKAKLPEKVKLKLMTKKEPTPEPVAPPPKRKGPGRPPKNGIISKRAQAELAKQAREAAKAAALGEPSGMPGRGKGKSIPGPVEAKQEESNLQPNGKRKYKKRKSKADTEGGEQQAVRDSTEHTESVPPEQNAAPAPAPKPPKPVKPPKPPRSPSPVFDEATMTAEQLAKPQSSYVVLIHDALSNSKTGQMSLPQIYRAIERKYPFYKLRVQTNGWQSSVRHNLSQHPAFCKIERDGKGWMWGLVPEVSIEKEKKRRMTPPPMPTQGYYPAPQMMPSPYPYPMPYPPYAAYTGMPIGQRPPYLPPPPHFVPQATASSLPPALANAVDSSSTYQSPYATGSPSQTAEPLQPQQQAPTTDRLPRNPTTTSPKPPDTQLINVPPPSNNPNPPNQLSVPGPSSSSAALPYAPSQTPTSRLQHLLCQQTPKVAEVVQKFKAYLFEEMSDNPSAESLIDSAINRVLNPNSVAPPSTSSNTPNPKEDDDRHEKAIMNILQGMLDNLRQKHGEVGPSAPGDGSSSSGGNGGGTATAAAAAGSTSAGGMVGVGQGAAGRDPTFIQILERVSEKNDGTLPLPPPPAVIEDRVHPSGSDNGENTGGDARSAQGVEGRVNGATREEDDGGTFSEGHRLREEAVREEGPPRGVKRLLGGDDGEGDRAMDAQPREAKRVAT
ncbi:MAG: hypothetical protein L6R40_006865 [Gallowayella cf. fulva]|nr:MAG: hypothetical protein L6R40_006865 [Xanthomendoza cf. fulva]